VDLRGSWRSLHNEELHNLYSSRNVTTVIKSRNMSYSTRGIDEKCIGNFSGKA
jgi:hypothetical protein